VTRTVFLALLSACAAPKDPDGASFARASGKADAYGDVAFVQVADAEPVLQSVGRSVALITQDAAFVCEDGLCQTDVSRLGDGYGAAPASEFDLCSDEPHAFEPTTAAVGACTAFVAAEDLVATAGHCVLPSETFCRDRIFVFDFAITQGAEPRLVPEASIYRCAEIVELERSLELEEDGLPGDQLMDWALLRLDRPIDVAERPPLSLAPEVAEIGDAVAIVGHPFGLPMKVSTGTVRATPASATYFVHDVDTAVGSSGAPVLDLETGGLVGIHVQGSLRQPFVRDDDDDCNRLTSCDHVVDDDRECRGNVAIRLVAP
jgi:V8-like Glu-specific endopeptidase